MTCKRAVELVEALETLADQFEQFVKDETICPNGSFLRLEAIETARELVAKARGEL